jgi:hypothetical protein
MNTPVINRRDAIVKLAVLMGGTMVGPRLLQGAWDANAADPAATPEGLALLDEIGETIIPATATPGAKAVKIGAFISMMIRECYESVDQAAFRTGVGQLAENFRAKHGRAFEGAPAADRTAFLNELDREQRTYTAKKKVGEPAHYFRVLKELTILGYFSSEVGSTQALRFLEVPGAYNGSLPYKKGDRAWATG